MSSKQGASEGSKRAQEDFATVHNDFSRILESTRASGIANVQVFANEDVLRALGWSDGGLPFTPLEEGRSALRLSSGSLTAMCQYGLPESYIRQTLMGWRWDAEDNDLSSSKTNLILIQTDPGKNTIRGFSLCKVKGSSPEDATMEVLVLGNAQTPLAAQRGHDKLVALDDDGKTETSVEGRGGLKSGGRYARGGDTLKMIQVIGRNLTKGISLYALETVITLYYYFGWRFKSSCNSTERSHYAGDVSALKAFYKKWGNTDIISFRGEGAEETEREFHEEFKQVMRPFQGWGNERFKLMLASRFVDGEDEVREIAMSEAGENGFAMLLCQDLNPYSRLEIDRITSSMSGGYRYRSRGGNKFNPISITFKPKNNKRKMKKSRKQRGRGRKTRTRYKTKRRRRKRKNKRKTRRKRRTRKR